MNEKVMVDDEYFNEVVRVFVTNVITEFKAGKYVPHLNFIFDDKSINLFDNILKKFDLEEKFNSSAPTLVIRNGDVFFKELAEIVKLHLGEEISDDWYFKCKNVLAGLFFRMTPNDFYEVEKFLRRQRMFFVDKTFDKNVSMLFAGKKIWVNRKINTIWDETDKSISFTVKDENDNLI